MGQQYTPADQAKPCREPSMASRPPDKWPWVCHRACLIWAFVALCACNPTRVLATSTPDYGTAGPFSVSVETVASPLYLGRNVSVYLPTEATEPVPTLFFAHGFDGGFPVYYDGLLHHLASRGYAVVFSPYTSLGTDQTLRYAQLFAGFNAAASAFSTQLDTSRVGFIGHSYGAGANPWLAQRGLNLEGWGTNGAFMYSMAPWYSYLIDQQTLDQFPSHVQLVTQVFDDDRVNDHRMAIDVFDSINIAPDNKDYVTLRSDTNGKTSLLADHFVPLGATGSAQINRLDTAGIYRLIDALADSTFHGSAAGRDVALGGGSVAQVDMGAWPDGTPLLPLLVTDHPVAQYSPDSFVFPFDSSFNPRGLGVPLDTQWIGSSNGTWDHLANWSAGQTARAVTSVRIDPAGGGSIVGPSSATTIAHLTLGNSSSEAIVLELQATGPLTINGHTLIEQNGILRGEGALHAAGGLLNYGQLEWTGPTEIRGPVANAPGSRILVDDQNTVIFRDALLHQGDAFYIGEGARAHLLGPVSGGGRFTGTGTVRFEKLFAPGNSASLVPLAGNVEFGPAATLEIELGGYTPGLAFDQLQIAQHAVLDGSLSLQFLDDFVPRVGDSFEILTANSLEGGFVEILDPNRNRQWMLHYTPNQVNLTLVAIPEPSTLLLAGLGSVCLAARALCRKSALCKATSHKANSSPRGAV